MLYSDPWHCTSSAWFRFRISRFVWRALHSPLGARPFASNTKKHAGMHDFYSVLHIQITQYSGLKNYSFSLMVALNKSESCMFAVATKLKSTQSEPAIPLRYDLLWFNIPENDKYYLLFSFRGLSKGLFQDSEGVRDLFTSRTNPIQIDTILEPRPPQPLHMRRRCSAPSTSFRQSRPQSQKQSAELVPRVFSIFKMATM